jgi:hypothetical protein
MTQEQIKAIFERVLTWPVARQEDAARMLLLLEGQQGEMYHPSDEEWNAIQEGLEQADRGEVVSDEDMDRLWKQFGA